MKSLSRVFAVLLLVAFFAPVFSAVAWAETTSSSTVAVPPVAGRGWFVFNGFRHNFGFAVQGGKLSEESGWRYGPNGHLFLAVFDFEKRMVLNLSSIRVWRFRVDEVDGGLRAVIMGLARVHTTKGALEGWWFRAEVRDIDDAEKGADSFAISLWRPGGADKPGCWTARLFDPKDPRSVQLNPQPFYRAFGRLRGGFVEITPIKVATP
ncbi:MAG: hypothetical protein QXL10_01280 [Candidatus Bathyarchaeia archaeon]